MEFGDFVRHFKKGIKGFNQCKFAVDLCVNAGLSYLSIEMAKAWIMGKNRGYEKLFKDVEFDDSKFITFLRNQTNKTWVKIQYAFKMNSEGNDEVDLDTKEIDDFYKSVLRQFKEIVGAPYIKDTNYDVSKEDVNKTSAANIDSHIPLSGKSISLYDTYEYIQKSVKRKNYNEMELKASITYNVKNKKANGCSDVVISYNFVGINNTEYVIAKFIMYLSKSIESRRKNIKYFCTDILSGRQLKPLIAPIDNDNEKIEISMLFPNGNLKPGEQFNLQLDIDWEDNLDWDFDDRVIIVDPMNYSKKCTSVKFEIISTEAALLGYTEQIFKISRRNFSEKENIYVSTVYETNGQYIFTYDIQCIDDSVYIIVIV